MILYLSIFTDTIGIKIIYFGITVGWINLNFIEPNKN